MVSTIDPSVPVFGNATTLSVRQNFQRAYDEITVLQNSVGALPTRVSTAESNIIALQSSVGILQSDVADLKAAGPGSGNGTISALTTRVANVESAVGLLQTRMGTAEGNIGSLTTRMGTAEGKISALEAAGPPGGLSLPSTVTGTGALTLNTSGAATLPSLIAGTVLRVATAGSGNHPIIAIDAAGGVAVPRLQMRSAGGSFAGGIAATQSGVQIGWLEWMGYDGTDWRSVANIQCISTATFGASRPLRMEFQITRTGQPLPQTTMYLGAAGGLVVGNPLGADRGVGAINAQNLYSQFDTSVGGVLYIKGEEVSLGAPNSGGAGYSVLRVPNP